MLLCSVELREEARRCPTAPSASVNTAILSEVDGLGDLKPDAVCPELRDASSIKRL